MDEPSDAGIDEEVPHFELDTSPRPQGFAAPATTREFDPVDAPSLELAPKDGPVAKTAAPVSGEADFELGPVVTSAPLEAPLPRHPKRSIQRRELGRMLLDNQAPTPGFWRRIPVGLLVPFLGIGGIPWLLALGGLTAALLHVTFWGQVVIGLVNYGAFLVYFGQALRIGVDDEGGTLPKATWRSPSLDEVAATLPGGLTLLAVLVALGYVLAEYAPPWASGWPLLGAGVVLNLYLLIAWTRIGFGGGVLAGLDVVGSVQSMIAGGIPFLVLGSFYAVATTLVSLLAALAVLTLVMEAGGLTSMTFVVAGLAMGHAWVAGVCAYLIGRVLDERGAFRGR